MSEELYNSNDYCKLAEELEELKKENAELARDKDHLMNLFMESSEYVFDVVSNMKINDLRQKCKRLEADYVISNRELLILQQRIAELEAAQRWIPVSEPPKVSGKYLLLNIYDDVYPCDFIAGTEIWVLPDYDTVTHWMPLPKLPEVK